MKNDAEIKKKILREMEQDRQKLLMRQPFIGMILMHLDFIPVTSGCKTACTDGSRVFMNCFFYANLDLEERLFVLAHETWHCVLLHFARLQNRNQDRFNIATDLEIHFILQKEKMKEPFVLPHNPEWDGLSAEEIYEKLVPKKDRRGQPKKFKSSGCCSKGFADNSKSFDKHIYNGGADGREDKKISSSSASSNPEHDAGGEPDPDFAPENEHIGSESDGSDKKGISSTSVSNNPEHDAGGEPDPDFAPEVDAQSVEKIRQIVIQTACSIERRQGSLPGNLQSIVDRLRKPELNWKELLKQYITSCFGGERNWLPPSRRYLGMGLYLPSRRDHKFNAVMAIDTSGSTTNDLPQFFGELAHLLKSFGKYELTVIQCDFTIQHVEKFSGDTPLPSHYQWESHGHGGTSFVPPFEYVKEHKLHPDILIYLTDGYGDAPETAPRFPVLWVLTPDADKPANWGKQIRLKGENNDY